MKIITTAVIKGGTGKTTTAAALAQAAAADGQKVLAIDLDPQGNFSFIIGADPTQPGSFELINGDPAADLIQQTGQGIDMITASPDLSTIKTGPASAKRLQAALDAVKGNYDLIVIDTPPTMGELSYNALQAATDLLIPLEADINSLQGLYQICDIANQLQHSNPALTIRGTILTRFDPRPNINKYLQSVIAEKGADAGAPFLMAIRSGVAIREAQAMQQSIYDYAPNSKPAKDYKQLYKMIMEG